MKLSTIFFALLAVLVCCISWSVCLLIFKQTRGMEIKNFLAYSYFFALPFMAAGSFWSES